MRPRARGARLGKSVAHGSRTGQDGGVPRERCLPSVSVDRYQVRAAEGKEKRIAEKRGSGCVGPRTGGTIGKIVATVADRVLSGAPTFRTASPHGVPHGAERRGDQRIATRRTSW